MKAIRAKATSGFMPASFLVSRRSRHIRELATHLSPNTEPGLALDRCPPP